MQVMQIQTCTKPRFLIILNLVHKRLIHLICHNSTKICIIQGSYGVWNSMAKSFVIFQSGEGWKIFFGLLAWKKK